MWIGDFWIGVRDIVALMAIAVVAGGPPIVMGLVLGAWVQDMANTDY